MKEARPMSTLKIGQELVALCREGRNLEALDRLFSPDIESVEAADAPGIGRMQKGIAAVKAKNEWWLANHEIHSGHVTGPFPNGDRFIVSFRYEATNKPSGQRMTFEEMALYTVAGGKIVKEEFFYDMP